VGADDLEGFRKSRFREPPKVDIETYNKIDIGFDPRARMQDFQDLADQARRELGPTTRSRASFGRRASSIATSARC